MEEWERSPHWGPGTRPLVWLIAEVNDIFLFHRLIYEQNYHINLEYLDYTESVGARLHQHIIVGESK